MKSINEQIRLAVLQKIRPTKQEIRNQRKTIDILRNALVEEAENVGQDYRFIEAEGSTGPKQTQLHGASDIDLFVGLNPDQYDFISKKIGSGRNKLLSDILGDLVENWFIPAAVRVGSQKVLKAYSQHPYLSLVLNGLDVDVIACFALTERELAEQGPITAVDRTVHHTRYVTKHLNDTLRDDVRILKSFVRASHAYGDACAVGQMGFTGYALELLTIVGNGINGAFDRLLHIREKPIDSLHRPNEVLQKIPRFRNDFVIIVDPIDTQRNVASSFSPRSVKWVMKRLTHMLSLDVKEDFDNIVDMILEKQVPTDHLPIWLQPHCVSRSFHSDGKAHYTLYRDKLYRLAGQIALALQREPTGEPRFGEILWEIYFEGDVFAIGFVIEHPEIKETFIRRGPPIRLHQAVKKFREQHPEAIEREGYIWAITKRRWTKASEMIDSLIKDITSEGFETSPETGSVPARALNTLYRYVLRIEEDFPLSRRQEYKEALQSLEW